MNMKMGASTGGDRRGWSASEWGVLLASVACLLLVGALVYAIAQGI